MVWAELGALHFHQSPIADIFPLPFF
jgi:hypothetical protein